MAALSSLHEEGPRGLNIQALARRLNISKTSFYWHFRDKSDLAGALIDHWRHEFTEIVTNNVELLNLPPKKRLATAMDLVDKHDLGNFDSSIRIWARTNPRAENAVREVNKLRLDFASQAFAELGFSGKSLECRAALWVGYQSSERYVFPEFSAVKRKAMQKKRLEILTNKGAAL